MHIKLLRISLITLLFLFTISAHMLPQQINTKDKKQHHAFHTKKDVKISPNKDTSQFLSRPIHHDQGISKEDSIKIAIQGEKADIRSYLFLKYGKQYSSSYADSLYDSGFRMNYAEFSELRMKYHNDREKLKKK